ncbi:uncharacterized protein BXZ73DRAFT_80436 [Epithele typhae]|uniref:uncharacterized protein n=1 Tax=Epithele typhae TaxID=378194 RepID=UPI0020088BB8|nr:uncharacterized protein BXZ73DRAFT_80436 [Epithele typhae]KAH9918896.1 hypothetical protein BXZ73DRAFT_80436 [Epithele typhae]
MSDSSNSTAAAAAAAAAAATAAFPHIPVGDTLGAWLIALQGMLFHQAFKYYMTFHKDRWVLKAWVAVVLVLETLATVLITHTAYFYMVTKYWEPTYFFVSPTVWSLNVLPPPAALAAFISQSFFARRLWLIAPKFRILVAVASAQMVLIAGNVEMFPNSPSAEPLLQRASPVGDTLGVAPILVARNTRVLDPSDRGSVDQRRVGVYPAHKQDRDHSLWDDKEHTAEYVLTLPGNSIVHIVNVTYSAKEPDNFIYAALSIILTKLYANAFLVALNSRASLGILGQSNNQSNSVNVSHVLRARGATNLPTALSNTAASNPTAIELKVTTVTETDDFYDGAYAVSEPGPLEAQQQQQPQRSFLGPKRHPYAAEVMTP